MTSQLKADQVNKSSSESAVFNREKFLFRMLALIFLWQGGLFTYGVVACMNRGGLKECPSLGDRFETTVQVMVATNLALLGTTAMLSSAKKNKEDSDHKPTSKT